MAVKKDHSSKMAYTLGFFTTIKECPTAEPKKLTDLEWQVYPSFDTESWLTQTCQYQYIALAVNGVDE